MLKKALLISAIVLSNFLGNAQNVGSSLEYIKALTSEWKGDRFPDGRPKVPDAILKRLKNISIEEAWGVLLNFRAGVELPEQKLTLSVCGSNLLEEKYIVSAGNTGSLFGDPTQIPGAPRMFGTKISWKF